MYPESKVIDEIIKITEAFKMNRVDMDNGDALSKASLRLSILMINLGQLVAEASFTANSKYAFRKFKYAKDYKSIRQDIDMKVKDADTEAMIRTEESQKEEVEAQYQADLLKTLYDDCERVIMNIQTRIGFLKSERINSNVSGNVINS